MNIKEVELKPELTLEEAKIKWETKRLDQSCLRYPLPTVSTRYLLPDGQVPLLYLRGVLAEDSYNQAEASLRKIDYSPASNSRRECLKDSPGGEFLMGYNDNRIAGYDQQYPEWTAPSVHEFPLFKALWPLCRNMQDLLGEYEPGYWQGRENGQLHGPALRGELEENESFAYPWQYRELIRQFDEWPFYSVPGTNWSTLTGNKDTIFRAHQDANNSSGARSCLAAFGKHFGNELAFPRLGVSFAVGARDLLICNCPVELHGNIPPCWGMRMSLVAYTREALTTAGRFVDWLKS